MFVTAMIIITVGEMVIAPFQQSVVASYSPEDMRGRYMAVSGLSWSIACTIGPYFAGVILDGPNPNTLWYVSGFIGILAAIGFLVLNKTHHPVVAAQKADQAVAE